MITPVPSVAVSVWSEDFEDGDYDGWTVLSGSYSATSGVLVPTGEKTTHHKIRHDSNTAYGTWSFDVFLNQSNYLSLSSIEIYFLADEIYGYSAEWAYVLEILVDPDPGWPMEDFRLRGFTPDPVELGIYSHPEGLAQHQHIDITRDTNGHFNVFVNGTLIIEGIDNELTSARYFVFESLSSHGLDNITVNNEITIEPEAADRANLQFIEDSVSKNVDQGQTVTFLINVTNEGKATGYGTVTILTPPSGITVESIGSDFISQLVSNTTKNKPMKIEIDSSVKTGTYNVSIELRDESTVFDTLTLTIEVSGKGTGTPGFEIWVIIVFLSFMISQRKRIR
jgi:hypothetical protein